MAAPDEAKARETREAEHQQSIPEIADEISAQKAQRHQPPEGRIAEALRVRAVGNAEQGDCREHCSGQRVEPVQRDHLCCPSTRSKRSSRAPWIRKAAIALGIAHSASSSGARL